MTAEPEFEDFARHLNSVFVAPRSDGAGLELTLIDVNQGRPSDVLDTFCLVFRAPLGTPPVSQTYELEHAQLGKLAIFLSPYKADSTGLYLEAVFNRLRPKL